MISFIVIGRNESRCLRKCFQSILDTISQNNINNHEIIFVDSNSEDNSIKIAQEFEEIRIFKLTDYYNAAIGRNIGFKESKGDLLFFIDGDMEIIPEFIDHVLTDKNILIYPFVSGTHIEVTMKDNVLKEIKYGKGDINRDQYFTETGGIFIITRELWLKADGMRNEFKRSQDIDLALRLAKIGFPLLRKKEIINKHYPSENRKTRNWKMLLDGKILYSGSLLIRKNVFNKYLYRRLLRTEYTLLLIIICSLFSFYNIIFIFPYLFIVFLRALKKGNPAHLFIWFPYFVIRDLITLSGIFFFYPAKIRTEIIPYVKVQ